MLPLNDDGKANLSSNNTYIIYEMFISILNVYIFNTTAKYTKSSTF